MLENRLKITFESLDAPIDGVIKQNEWGDVYEQTSLLFETYLPVFKEYEEKYREERYTEIYDMKRKIIIYNINHDNYSHTVAMVNMLQLLDIDLGFELYHE